MIVRASRMALVAGLFVAGSAFAQVPPLPAPESDVVCDDDTDPATPENENACDCAIPPSPDAANPRGCVAAGPGCLAGDPAGVVGCLSVAGGGNVCSTGPGAVSQCDDATCAAVASAGCSGGGGGGGLPPLPVPVP